METAVIGAGAMGSEMARHLVANGHRVYLNDTDPARLAAAADLGASAQPDLAALVPLAELFLVVVADDAQTRAVVSALLAGGPKPGAVIAVAATCHPQCMRALAADCEAAGVAFIDAPVVFGRQGASQGTLGTLCGGAVEVVERVRPVLMSYSRFVERVGPVGAGQLAKACNNMLHWAACCANYEVLLLAKRYGVDAQRMRDVLLECPGRNTTLERWDTTRFTWHEKDMDIALDLAQAGSLSLPLFGQVDQLVKTLGPDQVAALLHGPEAQYLGATVRPLPTQAGGIGPD